MDDKQKSVIKKRQWNIEKKSNDYDQTVTNESKVGIK